ncbi:unnamed protein product [Schistosoma turkestanicum]|nr:unnamed protein product [Schistosoma turkestanicum]
MIPKQITSLLEFSSHTPVSTSVLPSTTDTNESTFDRTIGLFKFIQTASYAQNILKQNSKNSQYSNILQEYTEHENKVDEYVNHNQGDLNNIQCGLNEDLKHLVNHSQPCQQIATESYDHATDNSQIINTFETIKPITTLQDNSEASTWNPSKLYQLCNEIKQYQEYSNTDNRLSTDLILLLDMLNDSASTIVESAKLSSNNNIYNDNSNHSNYDSYNVTKSNNANIDCIDRSNLLYKTNTEQSVKLSTNNIYNDNSELSFMESQEKLTSDQLRSNNTNNNSNYLRFQHGIQQQQPQSKLYDTSNKKPVLHWAKLGVPQPASPTRYSAPVHIDVGGTLYTSSLKALTKYPNSILGKMFNGTIPIVLDTMKQHYFIDRDGTLFRHVLNFLRTNKVNLDPNFTELDQLVEEATFYGLDEMVNQLKQIKTKLKRKERHYRRYFQEEENNETELRFPPKKQKLEYNDLCVNSAAKTISEIPTFQERIATSSPVHQQEESRNDLPLNNITQSKCFYILMEIDKVSPHQGRMIFSECNNLRLIECFSDLNNYFADYLPNSYQIKRCENYSEIEWFMMSTYNQLKLWELLLNHNCEMIVQYQLKQTDRNCNICIFRSK